MGTEENREVVRRLLAQAWCTSNVDLVDELLAVGYRCHGPARTDATRDREAAKEAIAGLFTAVPDLWVAVEEMVAEGDRVVARYTVRGTLRGAPADIPPAERRVLAHASGWFRVQAGQIAEEWQGAETRRLLQRVGATARQARRVRERGGGAREPR